MHIAESGAGPLVVLCHGFPETWYSWRHQLQALAKAGFHAIAPDMRGYGQTDRPEQLDQYTLLHHVGDVVGLLDALGTETAVIVGHDWGAPVAWYASLLRRDRSERAVHTSTTRSPYQHYAEDRGRGVLSAVLPIPRHRRGGVRARRPSEHSQLPLLGFRGRPGCRCKGRLRNRYGAAP